MSRPVAQLAERWSPKPQVGGSIPSWPATQPKSLALYMVNKSINMQNYIRWFLGIAIIGIAVYGNSYFAQEALLYRVLAVILVSGLGLFVISTTEEGKESLKIILESRTEIRRVVWPTRVETTQTTLIVLVAITVAALMLWGLDSLFGWATAKLLG